METVTVTLEQLQGLAAAHQRALEQQKARQARYYQRNADKRKAYAKEYYQRRKESKAADQPPTTPPPETVPAASL